RFAGVEVPAQRVGALAVDVREHGLTVFGQPLADIATVGSANTAEAGFRGGVALEKFVADALHHRSVGAIIVREFEGRFLGGSGRKTAKDDDDRDLIADGHHSLPYFDWRGPTIVSSTESALDHRTRHRPRKARQRRPALPRTAS